MRSFLERRCYALGSLIRWSHDLPITVPRFARLPGVPRPGWRRISLRPALNPWRDKLSEVRSLLFRAISPCYFTLIRRGPWPQAFGVEDVNRLWGMKLWWNSLEGLRAGLQIRIIQVDSQRFGVVPTRDSKEFPPYHTQHSFLAPPPFVVQPASLSQINTRKA